MGRANRSLPRRISKIPSPVSRAGGFLFLAARLAHGAGAPWFERLGIDPAWLASDPTGSANHAVVLTGLSVRTSSDLAIRAPVRIGWGVSEFVQTYAGTIRGEGMELSPWFQTVRSVSNRRIEASRMSMESPGAANGLRAGTTMRTPHLEAMVESDLEDGRHRMSGALRIQGAGGGLEAGGSSTGRRSKLEFRLPEGDLDLDWNDLSDSLGMTLVVPVGPFQWTAGVWRGASRSPGNEGVVDTGRSGGWSLATGLETPVGRWTARYARENFELHTIGILDGRVFHDKNWQSMRVALELGWNARNWQVQASTRQIRLDIVPGGLDQAMVDWNMIPADAFTRIGAVLGSQSEFVVGSLHLERWSAMLSRAWKRGGADLSAGMGPSWTRFEGRVDRTTLTVRGLFPYLSDDKPLDGTGWLAMADLRAACGWSMGKAGTVAAHGAWHQPLAGNWTPRASGNTGSSSSPKSRTNPVDPLGFREGGVQWMLAW